MIHATRTGVRIHSGYTHSSTDSENADPSLANTRNLAGTNLQQDVDVPLAAAHKNCQLCSCVILIITYRMAFHETCIVTSHVLFGFGSSCGNKALTGLGSLARNAASSLSMESSFQSLHNFLGQAADKLKPQMQSVLS